MPTEDVYSSGHLVLSHFGTCKCSNVETNLSYTFLVSGLLSFEHPSVLLFCFKKDPSKILLESYKFKFSRNNGHLSSFSCESLSMFNTLTRAYVVYTNAVLLADRVHYGNFYHSEWEIQKNWCTVTMAPTIEHHGGHSRTPANQRWDQVPGRSQRLLLG